MLLLTLMSPWSLKNKIIQHPHKNNCLLLVNIPSATGKQKKKKSVSFIEVDFIYIRYSKPRKIVLLYVQVVQHWGNFIVHGTEIHVLSGYIMRQPWWSRLISSYIAVTKLRATTNIYLKHNERRWGEWNMRHAWGKEKCIQGFVGRT
jgi:hypothetical protein